MVARAKSSTRSWGAAAAAVGALVLLVATASAQSLETTCYHKVNGVEHVTSPGGGPCGTVSPDTGFLSCCAVGDQCVEGGLCHFTHPPNPYWSQSGYYLGACTDPSLADPHCNIACGNLKNLDITFDTQSKKWLCCGSTAAGNVTCNDPTTQTVVAKPIASLATTYVVPSVVLTASGTSTPTSSSSSSSGSSAGATSTAPTGGIFQSSTASTSTPAGATSQSSTATSAPDSQKSSGSTSHTGAIVGGVVGGLAFIALVAGGGWFWYRRQKGSSAALSPDPRYELGLQGYYAPLGKDSARGGRAELGTAAPNATEMSDGSRVATELP